MVATTIVPLDFAEEFKSFSKVMKRHTFNFFSYMNYHEARHPSKPVLLMKDNLIKKQSDKWYRVVFLDLVKRGLLNLVSNYKVGERPKGYKMNLADGASIIEVKFKLIAKDRTDGTIDSKNIKIHREFISGLDFSKINTEYEEGDTLKTLRNKVLIQTLESNNYSVSITNHRLYSPYCALSKEFKKKLNKVEVDIKSAHPQILESLIPLYNSAMSKKSISEDEAKAFGTAIKKDIYLSLTPNQDRKLGQVQMLKLLNTQNSTVVEKVNGQYRQQPLYQAFKTQFPNILEMIKWVKRTKKMYEVLTAVENQIIQGAAAELYKQGIICGSNHDALYCNNEDSQIVTQTIQRRMTDLGLQGLVG